MIVTGPSSNHNESITNETSPKTEPDQEIYWTEDDYNEVEDQIKFLHMLTFGVAVVISVMRSKLARASNSEVPRRSEISDA